MEFVCRPGRRCRRLSLLVIVAAFGACSDDPVRAPVPPAERGGLQVQASPPQPTDSGFSLDVSWSAPDLGEVPVFEWAIGFSRGSNRYLPPTALDWTRTSQTSVTLHFEDDASTPWVATGTDPRSRTFYIRGHNADGSILLATQEVSFTPLSLAPHVVVPVLDYTTVCRSTGIRIVVPWIADDADSKGLVPESVRYVVLPASSDGNCINRTGYLNTDPIGSLATEDLRWSPWIPYDKHGNFHGYPGGVELTDLIPGQGYLIGVQARDADGATSRSFHWNFQAISIRVEENRRPSMHVVEQSTGMDETFVAPSRTIGIEAVAGQPVSFQWVGAAQNYLGSIEAYRYGWNLADPDDPHDPGWAVDWGIGPAWTQSTERRLAAGAANFVVEARDNSGAMTRGIYEITVRPLPSSRRPLLLVDDVHQMGPDGDLSDAEEDAFWNHILSSLLADFDSSVDAIDTQIDANRLTLSNVLNYEAVLWHTNASAQSFLHTRFAPPSQESRVWNWLRAYQVAGGNLLLVGAGAMMSSLPSSPRMFEPIVFEDTNPGEFGFGSILGSDGQRIPLGRYQWGSFGFCLDAVGHVRPAATVIFGEVVGAQDRTTACDAIHTAVVDPAFPGGFGSIVDLVPAATRVDVDPTIGLAFEEFYNFNPTNRKFTPTGRDCVDVMFRARTRRGAGVVADESTCRPRHSSESSLEGAPIGIMSRAYAATKPRAGSHDFLWGFNPVGFTEASVARALYWVLADDWGFAATAP